MGMFQCPSSGLSHFYSTMCFPRRLFTKVFQCPSSGLSHFYCRQQKRKRSSPNSFNALLRAYPISTCRTSTATYRLHGFNALLRAYPISTLGSRKPLWVRLPEGIFQSNCKYNFKMGIFRVYFLSLYNLSIFQFSRNEYELSDYRQYNILTTLNNTHSRLWGSLLFFISYIISSESLRSLSSPPSDPSIRLTSGP